MYYNNGNWSSEAVGAALMTVAGVLGIVLFFVLAFSLIAYIFEAIGLYTLAKRRGLRYPGLAWVPVANVWILGALADNYMSVTELRETRFRHILLGLEIALSAICIPVAVISLGSVLEAVASIADGRYYAAGGYVLWSFGIMGLSFVLFVLSVVLTVFLYIALYRIFKSCQPSSAVVYLILSIFFSVSLPFILFGIRNKDEGMIPAYVNPPYGEG